MPGTSSHVASATSGAGRRADYRLPTGALIPEKAEVHKGLASSIEDKSKSDDADEKAVAEGVLDLDGRNE